MVSNNSNIQDITYNNIIQPIAPTSATHVTNKYYAGTCRFYNLKSGCKKGALCQFLHIKEDLDSCNLEPKEQYRKMDDHRLHRKENVPKIQESNNQTFSRYHDENNLKYSPYRENKISNCPWYERGFCKFGSRCRFRHNENISPPYLEKLLLSRAKYFNFSSPLFADEKFRTPAVKMKICSYCKKPGHKASRCRQKKRNSKRLCRRCKCFEDIEATYKN